MKVIDTGNNVIVIENEAARRRVIFIAVLFAAIIALVVISTVYGPRYIVAIFGLIWLAFILATVNDSRYTFDGATQQFRWWRKSLVRQAVEGAMPLSDVTQLVYQDNSSSRGGALYRLILLTTSHNPTVIATTKDIDGCMTAAQKIHALLDAQLPAADRPDRGTHILAPVSEKDVESLEEDFQGKTVVKESSAGSHHKAWWLDGMIAFVLLGTLAKWHNIPLGGQEGLQLICAASVVVLVVQRPKYFQYFLWFPWVIFWWFMLSNHWGQLVTLAGVRMIVFILFVPAYYVLYAKANKL